MKALVISIWGLCTTEGEFQVQVPASPMGGLDHTKLEDKVEGGTSVESSIPCSNGGRALVVKGAQEVENAEANSKYQDKTEG
ncbi:hypothetical protein BHM03_00052434 [Ensete ventricosum]|uniref:Uncharacterized protein n=1 Tax=Ensete ventricosum TaxID=4639 RepID=A0A445MLS8_ENSVE|nr:hypothetical protein BHM03_00052434 [Ensete ventricosum]